MQAVVKMPHIEINIKGKIPQRILTLLREEYGEKVQLSEDYDEETVNIFETDWYKKTKAKITPGDNLKIYREMHGLTQATLGEMLGGIPRQHISNMERGSRAISLKLAQKFSQLLKVSVEKFV
jgi:DNA-binding XRE family transcriptional regulator